MRMYLYQLGTLGTLGVSRCGSRWTDHINAIRVFPDLQLLLPCSLTCTFEDRPEQHKELCFSLYLHGRFCRAIRSTYPKPNMIWCLWVLLVLPIGASHQALSPSWSRRLTANVNVLVCFQHVCSSPSVLALICPSLPPFHLSINLSMTPLKDSPC